MKLVCMKSKNTCMERRSTEESAIILWCAAHQAAGFKFPKARSRTYLCVNLSYAYSHQMASCRAAITLQLIVEHSVFFEPVTEKYGSIGIDWCHVVASNGRNPVALVSCGFGVVATKVWAVSNSAKLIRSSTEATTRPALVMSVNVP